MTTYLEAELDFIHPSPTNPRKSFPAADMEEMIDSVRRHGVIQPVLVRYWPPAYISDSKPNKPIYELIAGERRYRAAQGAGLKSIPVMVRHLSDHEVLEIQIIENLQRKGLHPLEEAESYALMIKEHGYDADQLAEKIGKSRAYIYGRMKLTALCTKARLAFRDGKLNASTALLIARIPGPALQESALDRITASHRGILSYRDAADVIQREFCLQLEKAPFPQENLLLVATAGGCAACPKRSGSNPERFPDIQRADVCTDPDCYRAKTQAWLAYQKAQASEAGKKIIEGDAARKIDIAYSHDKYMPLDRKNYEIDGAPTYRETVAQTEVETILVEDHRTGTLVEVVERKTLAAALVAAGIKPERDYRHEERELERKVRAENEYRRRLFATWHTELQSQLATDDQPDFEQDELALIAGTLWSNLYGESQEVVMGYWAQPSNEKEAWNKRSAMVREVAERIPGMPRKELILLMLDCALAGGARASASSVDTPPARLIEHAAALGIDAERIRNDIADEKTQKASKKSSAKTTSTPTKAPLGEVPRPAIRAYVLETGDRVQVKPDAELLAKGKLGYFRGYNPEGQAIVWLDNEAASFLCRPDELDTVPITESTPPMAARPAPMYCHPENPDLCWTGRGRKPKWVESWLATDGHTLGQLLITNQKKPSSAPTGANAKPCLAETLSRCTKTLDLPLA